jgi:hypothetical protein
MEPEGIILNALTDGGERRLLLDSGASRSLLHLPHSADLLAPIKTMRLQFGALDSGPWEFETFRLPSVLHGVDGILETAYIGSSEATRRRVGPL